MGNIPGTGNSRGTPRDVFFPRGIPREKNIPRDKMGSRGTSHRPPRDTMVMPWVPTGSPVGTWENTILMLYEYQGYKL